MLHLVSYNNEFNNRIAVMNVSLFTSRSNCGLFLLEYVKRVVFSLFGDIWKLTKQKRNYCKNKRSNVYSVATGAGPSQGAGPILIKLV